MARNSLILIAVLMAVVPLQHAFGSNIGVRLKDLARIDGTREIALVGYGIVVGLQGTGDSPRNKATIQSLANTLSNFGLNVDESDLNSKNAAAVMVTAELPAFAEPGDRIDLTVASMGDAKSLNGGTLLLTPLYGPNNLLYALGQGAVAVGGYQIESYANLTRKNHTNVGQIPRGATIERASPNNDIDRNVVTVILNEPDYTTANRLVTEVKNTFDLANVKAVHPGKVTIRVPENVNAISFISRLENIQITPDLDARVVVNERTGTIVAGSNVILGEVSIAHGDLRIEVETTFDVSQPALLIRPNEDIRSVVTPETNITVTESLSEPVSLPAGTTVGELVQALNRIKLSTRDIIMILQSIKAAGALHAELIIQ